MRHEKWNHQHIAATAIIATAAVIGGAGVYFSHVGPPEAYPDSHLTPGVVATTDFNEITADYNGQTYSRAHRKTTGDMKAQVCAEYPDNCKGQGGVDFEIDHYCPLAIGCADDVKNLWAEPSHVLDKDGNDWGFPVKDKLESILAVMVKNASITPAEAQKCILDDWIQCYKKYVGHGFGSIAPASDPDNE